MTTTPGAAPGILVAGARRRSTPRATAPQRTTTPWTDVRNPPRPDGSCPFVPCSVSSDHQAHSPRKGSDMRGRGCRSAEVTATAGQAVSNIWLRTRRPLPLWKQPDGCAVLRAPSQRCVGGRQMQGSCTWGTQGRSWSWGPGRQHSGTAGCFFFSACPTPRHAASSSFHLLRRLATRIACAFFFLFFSPTPPSLSLSVSPSIFNHPFPCLCTNLVLARSLSQLPSLVLVYLWAVRSLIKAGSLMWGDTTQWLSVGDGFTGSRGFRPTELCCATTCTAMISRFWTASFSAFLY